MASSLFATAAVCAQESVADAGISCGGTVHAEGDGDQVPTDADRGVPHHHGSCHGHAFAIDAMAAALPVPTLAALAPVPRLDTDSTMRAFGPALRPPRG